MKAEQKVLKRVKDLRDLMTKMNLDSTNQDLMDLEITYSRVWEQIDIKFVIDPISGRENTTVHKLTFNKNGDAGFEVDHDSTKFEVVLGDSDDMWNAFVEIDSK